MKFHVNSFHIQVLLDCVLGRLFTPKSFESDYALIEKFDGDTPLKVPDAVQKDQLVAWVEAIKNQQVFIVLFEELSKNKDISAAFLARTSEQRRESAAPQGHQYAQTHLGQHQGAPLPILRKGDQPGHAAAQRHQKRSRGCARRLQS